MRGAAAIERLWEEGLALPGVALGWDHGSDAPLPRCGAIGLGVVSLVPDHGARIDLRPKVEEDREAGAVAGLSGRQVEGEGAGRASRS